jgi:outer membrane murein-binding lipoprotein Lpp
MLKKLLFSGTLVIIIWSGILLNTASSQQTDFRVNNIESDLRRLESRLNQIELSIGQNREPPTSRTTVSPSKTPNPKRTLSQSERDKIFDRLSTLVIELKQQVNNLTKRVTQLESRK